MSKKVLLLGGSQSKSIAITKAKEAGYFTVLCDYLPDNYGRNIADKFYLESTTDNDAILKVAKAEKVDGIVSYASDYGAPAAAYASEALNLPTNPYESVMILREKDRFREFLQNNNFACPKAKGFSNKTYTDEIAQQIKDFNYPLMVKPTDSCGSNGVSKITSESQLSCAYNEAMGFSLQKKVIIEEYIENDYPFVVGGDVFLQHGEVVCWGLLNCHRDKNVNPLVPTGKSYPVQTSPRDTEKIKDELLRLFSLLKVTTGAFNVEVIVCNSTPYLIEVGPRNGGNEIPDFLSVLTDSDIITATIEAALGNEDFCVKQPPLNTYMSTYNIHSDKDGTYLETKIKDEYSSRVIRRDFFVESGSKVKKFDRAGELIGIVFLRHDNIESMNDMMDNPHKWLEVVVK